MLNINNCFYYSSEFLLHGHTNAQAYTQAHACKHTYIKREKEIEGESNRQTDIQTEENR